MSRVGKKPIAIPKGVKINVSGMTVTVEGPKGKLSKKFIGTVSFDVNESTLVVNSKEKMVGGDANRGLVRALLSNMVVGVSAGFSKVMTIKGVGYKVDMKGSTLVFSLGYSHPIEMALPTGVTAKIEEKQTKLILESADREVLGEFCANVRMLRAPEPYKGKGVRYENEVVHIKEGKSSATSTSGGASGGAKK